MKTNFQSRSQRRIWTICAAACLCGGGSIGAAEEKAEPENTAPAEKKDEAEGSAQSEHDYRNWFDVSVGGTFLKGNAAQFKERHQIPQGAYGGVSDFHYEQDVGKKGLFEIDGRGIFDNHDYSLRLNFEHPDYGYLRGGYREFRTWYNASGGYLPVNDGIFHLENEELFIDRGEFWIEGGLTLPEKPILTFRYSHQFREGDKDSTIWGETQKNLPNARGIVPSFLDIDEERDIFQIDGEHTLGNTRFGVGLVFENSKIDNSRNIRRKPEETADTMPDLERHR